MFKFMARLNAVRISSLFVALGVIVVTLEAGAHAQSLVNLNLFSTGQSTVWSAAVQTQVSTGTSDTPWTIASMPGGGTANALVTNPHSTSWVPDTTSSLWISNIPDNSGSAVTAAGAFDYRTSFFISTNVVLSTVQIQFSYAADDSVASILLKTGEGNHREYPDRATCPHK